MLQLIHDFRPVHPTAKLIQAIPKEAFEALRARYEQPCWCVLHLRPPLAAASRLTHTRCGFVDAGFRNAYFKRCVGMIFNNIHREARKKENSGFYKELAKLLYLVA